MKVAFPTALLDKLPSRSPSGLGFPDPSHVRIEGSCWGVVWGEGSGGTHGLMFSYADHRLIFPKHYDLSGFCFPEPNIWVFGSLNLSENSIDGYGMHLYIPQPSTLNGFEALVFGPPGSLGVNTKHGPNS